MRIADSVCKIQAYFMIFIACLDNLLKRARCMILFQSIIENMAILDENAIKSIIIVYTNDDWQIFIDSRLQAQQEPLAVGWA